MINVFDYYSHLEKSDTELSNNELLSYVENALSSGFYSLTYELSRQYVKGSPGEFELRHFSALSLAKLGAPDKALDIAKEILKESNSLNPILTEEVLSLLGRIYKDKASSARNISYKYQYLKQSINSYNEAYLINKGYYPGINLATLLMISGDKERSKKVAEEVLKQCISVQDDNFWRLATIAEAYCILDQKEDSKIYFKKAITSSGNSIDLKIAVSKQLFELNKVLCIDEEILSIVDPPNVCSFAGHLIDKEESDIVRFPLADTDLIRKNISKAIEENNIQISYSGCAAGADIIFLELMQEKKLQTHILIPFDQNDFFEVSIKPYGEMWGKRYKNVIKKATSVKILTGEAYSNDDILFRYSSRIMLGRSLVKARQLRKKPIHISVISESASLLTGGTLETLNDSKSFGHKNIIIKLPKYSSKNSHQNKISFISKRDIKTMIFADIVGFSKLNEEESLTFYTSYLNSVSELLKKTDYSPDFVNTWGDGLFFVYKDIKTASKFSMDLMKLINAMSHSPDKDISIRVGMHIGPVLKIFDPILKKNNFIGHHVNIAARIEPICLPGHIYLSENAHAYLELYNDGFIQTEYVGRIILPKNSGEENLYLIKY